MKPTERETGPDATLSAIARELRTIRMLLGGFLWLAVAFMGALYDRGMPVIILMAGLAGIIVWAVVGALVRRSRRARREAGAFQRLSGRAEKSTR